MIKIPVSKGFSHRIANLEIEPFDHAGVVLFFGSKIVHQQFFVISQGFDEFFEWFQLAPHRAGAPGLQILPSVMHADIAPKNIKAFFDLVCTHSF